MKIAKANEKVRFSTSKKKKKKFSTFSFREVSRTHISQLGVKTSWPAEALPTPFRSLGGSAVLSLEPYGSLNSKAEGFGNLLSLHPFSMATGA